MYPVIKQRGGGIVEVLTRKYGHCLCRWKLKKLADMPLVV